MRAVHPSFLVVGLVVSSCCWGKSSTRLIVPSTDMPELRTLAQTAGARAQVITTAGEMVYIDVKPGAADTLHGTDKSGEVTLPFDSLALVYYTAPQTNPKKPPQADPQVDDYPSLSRVGHVERSMDCAQLDSEVGRASAIRWYPRSMGYGLPEATQHPKAGEIGALVGIGVLAAVVCLAGGCAHIDPTAFHRHEHMPDYDRAVYAADERIDGLLHLKADKHCDGRPTLRPDATDLQLWNRLNSAANQPTKSKLTARLARTAAFDLMGPDVGARTSGEVYEVSWLPNNDRALNRRELDTLESHKASLALADREVVVTLHDHDPAGQESEAETEVRVPYSAINSVEWGAGLFGQAPMVLRWSDGQFAGLQTETYSAARLISIQHELFLAMGRDALERSSADERTARN
jgi:hypothetical protein